MTFSASLPRENTMSMSSRMAVSSVSLHGQCSSMRRNAALMLAPDTLRGLRSAESVSQDDVVLVIDVNLASGTSMATTARQVRRQGAQHVLGAVMHFLADN